MPCDALNRGGGAAHPHAAVQNDSTRCAETQSPLCPLWVKLDRGDQDPVAIDVRFAPKADIASRHVSSPLCANSGHSHCSNDVRDLHAYSGRCVYRKPRLLCNGDRVRRGAHGSEYFRSAVLGARAAHLCPTIGAFCTHYMSYIQGSHRHADAELEVAGLLTTTV